MGTPPGTEGATGTVVVVDGVSGTRRSSSARCSAKSAVIATSVRMVRGATRSSDRMLVATVLMRATVAAMLLPVTVSISSDTAGVRGTMAQNSAVLPLRCAHPGATNTSSRADPAAAVRRRGRRRVMAPPYPGGRRRTGRPEPVGRRA